MSAARERFRARRIERQLDRCRHFTGLNIARFTSDCGAGKCAAGIDYDTITGAREAYAGGGLRLPCFLGGRLGPPACPYFEKRTREEVEAEEAAAEAHVKALIATLQAGECPTHKRKVERVQVGKCVYGDCGCRLYQGRLQKEKRS